MWSTKWYLKRNLSCDVYLLNELLETDVPRDDAIVVSPSKLRKLRDSLSELRSSVCEGRLERTFPRPAPFSVKTVQFFRQIWSNTVNSLSLIDSVWGALEFILRCQDGRVWRRYIWLWLDEYRTVVNFWFNQMLDISWLIKEKLKPLGPCCMKVTEMWAQCSEADRLLR
jgi:hypothetical protein